MTFLPDRKQPAEVLDVLVGRLSVDRDVQHDVGIQRQDVLDLVGSR